MVETNGFTANNIHKESDFFKVLKAGDIVVIDGYHFDTSYQRNLLEAKIKLVCIDDLHDKEFLAHMIVNHAPGVKSDKYLAPEGTQYLLGPKYALLRP